jgi:cytochrome bd-type quinol oxidase subunit 2
MQLTSTFLPTFLANLPLILIWLVGIILALVRWNRHPQASAFALIGLLILLFTAFFGSIVAVFPSIIHTRGIPFSRAVSLAGIVNAMIIFVRAVGWGFVLAAIFANRHV